MARVGPTPQQTLWSDQTEDQTAIIYQERYRPFTTESTVSTVTSVQPAARTSPDDSDSYVTYRQRWMILLSVLVLNLSNYSHWIAFASVQSKVAEFYRINEQEAKRICTVSYGLGIPCCLLATIVLAKFGLRAGLYVGATFTVAGGLLCCLSSFPGLTDLSSPAAWYWMAVVGQALTGVGSPFISCVPTKVSQHWFNERQRPIATTILSLSNPIGLVFGQAVTPFLVPTAADIPVMNIVLFVPALVGSIMTFLSVTRSKPPTPPSRSAALDADGTEKTKYLTTVKSVLTNRPYLILAIVVGGAMAYISAQQLSNEPVMCSLGYSNSFSGLSAGLVFVGGIFGSIFFGIFFNRFSWLKDKSIMASKVLMLPLAIMMTALVFLLQYSGMEAAIVAVYFGVGFFAIGIYPTMLEFAVEATYPNDEAVITAIIMVSSAIQGVIIIELQRPLTKDYSYLPHAANETCTQSAADSLIEPKDHTPYICFLSAYTMTLILIYFVFFNTEFKRTEANRVATQRKYSHT